MASLSLSRFAVEFTVVLAMICIVDACFAAEPTLSFQRDGGAIPLAPKDSQRIIREIEALVRSANFDSLHYPQFFEESKFRSIDKIEKDSFLHIHYGAPTSFTTIGGDLTADDIWIDIRLTDPNAGQYPGPTSLVSSKGVIRLSKESGVLLIAIGLDPAIYPHLPQEMQKTLKSGRKMLETYQEQPR